MQVDTNLSPRANKYLAYLGLTAITQIAYDTDGAFIGQLVNDYILLSYIDESGEEVHLDLAIANSTSLDTQETLEFMCRQLYAYFNYPLTGIAMVFDNLDANKTICKSFLA